MTRSTTGGLALALLLLACPAAAQDAPASQPTPASLPAAGKSESLEDPEDTDDDDDFQLAPAPAPGQPPTPATQQPAPAPVATPPAVDYGASARLQLSMDLAHEGSQPDGVAENVMELYGQFGASLHARPRRWLRLKVAGELLYRLTFSRAPGEDAFFGHQNRNELEPRLQDSFVELSTSWLDITAGMVTTVWGANTLVNPNDVLAARDLRDGPAVNPEALRLASPTLRAEAFAGDWTFSLLWMPGFIPNQVDLFGSDYAFFGPGAPGKFGRLGAALDSLLDDSLEGKVQDELVQSELPRPFKGSIVAAKVALSAGGWDLALQYVFNLSRTPVYRIQSAFYTSIAPYLEHGVRLTPEQTKLLGQMLMLMDDSPIDATYRRYHQLGLSLTRAVWKLVLSLDLAYSYKPPVVLGGAWPMWLEGSWYTTAMDSQIFAATAGARYSYGETVQVTLEGWYEVYIDIARMDAGQRPVLLLGGPHRAGLALLASYQLTAANLTFELGALVQLDHPGYVLMPKVSYRVGDLLQLQLGANLFGGSQGSTGGVFAGNDQLVLGLRGFL